MRLVGYGSTAKVYLCCELKENPAEPVAVKIFSRDYQKDAKAYPRIKNESMAL